MPYLVCLWLVLKPASVQRKTCIGFKTVYSSPRVGSWITQQKLLNNFKLLVVLEASLAVSRFWSRHSFYERTLFSSLFLPWAFLAYLLSKAMFSWDCCSLMQCGCKLLASVKTDRRICAIIRLEQSTTGTQTLSLSSYRWQVMSNVWALRVSQVMSHWMQSSVHCNILMTQLSGRDCASLTWYLIKHTQFL